MYNEMDPTSFRDPKAEEFILDWSREISTDLPLGLIVHLSRQAATQPLAANTGVRDVNVRSTR